MGVGQADVGGYGAAVAVGVGAAEVAVTVGSVGPAAVVAMVVVARGVGVRW